MQRQLCRLRLALETQPLVVLFVTEGDWFERQAPTIPPSVGTPSLVALACKIPPSVRKRSGATPMAITSYLVGFKAVRVARTIVVIPRDFTLGIDASVSGGNCPWYIRYSKLAFLE